MQRPWRGTVYSLAPHDSLTLLIESRNVSQGIALPRMGETSPINHQLRKCPVPGSF